MCCARQSLDPVELRVLTGSFSFLTRTSLHRAALGSLAALLASDPRLWLRNLTFVSEGLEAWSSVIE
ncbi:Uncharacterized protein DAT39_008998 [Clarias magur]|uniref:Uncharacterized protein n=1 Tax=Clarias magur TaxID=1594786 RepID=A0A8J4UMG6_CLAMG|nr:Uncharacterized protein DAT39_008998 [Clarias magur]